MSRTIPPSAGSRRGRPSKFGRPSQVVALTLPDEVVRGLRRVDPDLAWAIVRLFEKGRSRARDSTIRQADAELVSISDSRALIVVNRSAFKRLPGISIIPIGGIHAFLALEPGKGMADLELAVLDRLDDGSTGASERNALGRLRTQLRKWRHDRALRFHTRAIIVVERVRRPRRMRPTT